MAVAGASGAAPVATRGAAPVASWRPAPEYVQLFAPVREAGAYRAAVTPASIDDVTDELRSDPAFSGAPGGWTIRTESPLDTFGTAGPYNRWQLARAYGGRTARVARGVKLERQRVVEAWTVVSPYPSPDLRRLEEGTLRLVLTIAP